MSASKNACRVFGDTSGKNQVSIVSIFQKRRAIDILKPLFFCFFVFFWLAAGISPVYAGGRADQDLSRADELINEKQYDEAIRLLSEYTRRFPNRFDQAQLRLQRIYRIREEFNRVADEMLDTLINEPENSEKILMLSRRLEELESSTSPMLVTFISQIRELALFNVNRRRLQNILVQGRAQLDLGESQQALLTYASGRDIFRDEFFRAGYGEIIEDQVQRETARINEVIAAFPQSSASLGQASSSMLQAVVSGAGVSAETIYIRLTPAMNDFINMQQSLYEAANLFDRHLEDFRRNDPGMGDRNHLSFLSRLIYGRSGESIQEGMLGALETYWNNSAGALKDTITQNVEKAYSAGYASFAERNYSSAGESFEKSGEYIDLSRPLFDSNLRLKEGGNSRTVQVSDKTVLLEDAGTYLDLESMYLTSASFIEAAILGNSLMALENRERSMYTAWQQGNTGTDAAMNHQKQSRTSIASMKGDVDIIIAGVEEKETGLLAGNINPEDESIYADVVYFDDAKRAINNLHSILSENDLLLANRYYGIADTVLARSLESRRTEFNNGSWLIQGQSRLNDDGVYILDRYPAEGLAILSRMAEALEADIEQGNNFLADYRNEQNTILLNSGVASLYSVAQRHVNDLNSLRSQGVSMSAGARSQIAEAEAYRQEGERLFREAQAAFGRQDLETARDRLQRATDRFTNSLAIQESSSLRTDWDTRLVNLGQEIGRLENEMVIRDVRNLVNNARTTYFAGNFEQAEDFLMRARNRWAVTNNYENEEVFYWLSIVRSALSVHSGRVILPTAPLYPEMSQLLSEAKKNYEEGVRYINMGRRSDGIARFDNARQQTREIRLMFPINQEAGILELRMDQFVDPAAFNASFEQRLRNAIAGTKSRSLESFADLQNLAEINPRYPQISTIIRQAEIDMGYRPPPPNPQNLARSRELTVSANRILEGNISTQYEVALAQINEAIALNPENTEAMQVKDRLLNRMSAPGAIVLDSQDEAEYQRAVRELQSGNNLVALSIVERLLQNPRNRNITKLVELQRRIQSVL